MNLPYSSLQIIITTVEEKQKWMMNLTDAIAGEMIRQSTIKRVGENQNELQISPVWQPDSDHLDCSVCRVQFTLFFRRHHCRQCGNVVCATCSSNRMVINYYNKKQMERVCDICFSKKWKEPRISKQIGSLFLVVTKDCQLLSRFTVVVQSVDKDFVLSTRRGRRLFGESRESEVS